METLLLAFLDRHQLPYQRFEHPPVFTCEEAARLAPDLPGLEVKNLFLCDQKGLRHFLLVVPAAARVDLKALAPQLGAKGLRMASAERLLRVLRLTPGAVTVLAAFNDAAQQVEIVLDERVWQAPAILAHPLVNTATLALTQATLARFLALTGHAARIVAAPTPAG